MKKLCGKCDKFRKVGLGGSIFEGGVPVAWVKGGGFLNWSQKEMGERRGED